MSQTPDDLKIEENDWALDDQKFEEALSDDDPDYTFEKMKEAHKPGIYLHLDWAANILERGVDIRNKFLNPQQSNQPFPGLNYNPNPQPNPVNQKQNGNKTALIAGAVMVALAGVLIYKKTQK